MHLINLASLDMRNVPLRTKIRNAIKKLKTGECYITYVLKMDGQIIKFETNSKLKQGYSRKLLTKNEWILNKGVTQ